MAERPKYHPADQGDHLPPPPWGPNDPAVIAWEEAHGHDVRLKCYAEFGCLVLEPALEARIAELEAALSDSRLRVERLEALLTGWPEKLDIVAEWLDVLDSALDLVAESTRGRLREDWEAHSYGAHSAPGNGIQRDLRDLATQLRAVLDDPRPEETKAAYGQQEEESCVGCGRTPSEGVGCSSCPGYNLQGYPEERT